MDWLNWSDFWGVDVYDYELKWRELMWIFSSGDMVNVAQDMVDCFLSGNGGTYSNEILTQKARNHEDSERYIDETTKIINDWIKDNNGNISGLEYNASNRSSSVMVSNMTNNVKPPTYEDKFSGLGICVDGTYGNQFEITSYKFDGVNYEYTIKYTIYDVFGLDENDISNEDRLMDFGILAGFRAWYILQHYDEYGGNYKPFITYIEFEETIQGNI